MQPRKLVQRLAERGHEVHVIAGDINAYNEQREPAEQQPEPSGGSVIVHRIPGVVNIRANLFTRLRAYTGYVAPALRLSRKLPKPDLIIASIQPLFTGWAARRVAARHRVPWLLEVRDLWPDALEVKGALPIWLGRPLHALANSLYRSADRVVCITPGIKVELVRKGIDPAGIDVFPNGFDPSLFQIDPHVRDQERARLGWDGRFVALYTGTHTEVTAVETIIRAAQYVPADSGIRFDLVGYGQTKPKVQAMARDLGLEHVFFHDPVPKSQIPSLIAAADCCLMTLFESPLIHIYFENKLMDYMGAGKPIIAAMGGQQADLLRHSGAGRVVPSFDAEGLARLVVEVAEQPELARDMGQAGRNFVNQYLLLPDILQRYAEIVEAVAVGKAASIAAWEPLP